MNVSIIIPIKLESEDRKYNLKTILKYLNSYDIKKEIIIVEQYNNKNKTDYNVDQFLKENSINYNYLKVIKYPSSEDFFYKTKLINLGILNSKYKNVCIYDADVLVTAEQFVLAIKKLEQCNTVVKPFSQILVNIPKNDHPGFINFRNLFLNYPYLNLELIDVNLKALYTSHCVSDTPPGGCVFFNKDFIISVGLYNEEFKAYGPEDAEILERIKMLFLPINEINGSIFHLEHARTADSCCPILAERNNTKVNPYYYNNENLFKRIKKMSTNQLREYYNII